MKEVIPWQVDSDWPHTLYEVEIDPRRTALIVVDVQKYSPGNRRIADNCQRLRGFFRNHKLPVIFLRVGALLPGRRDMHQKRALAWQLHYSGDTSNDVVKGNSSFDVLDEVAPGPGDLIIDKNSSGAFNSSAIDHYLRAFEAQNLVLCGSSTSHCVAQTGRGAVDRGYNVVLVDDACRDSNPAQHRVTMRSFERGMGAVKTTTQVIDELGALLAVDTAISTPGTGD